MTPVEACRKYASQYDGNIVEIGAGHGDNTLEFLKIAKELGKKVIVIDPFEKDTEGTPTSYIYPKDIFLKKIEGYEQYLELHEVNSLSTEARKILYNTSICFAFIDGLQYEGAVIIDVRNTSHAICQCVDDYDRETKQSQVPSALRELGYKYETHGRWAYLL